MPTRVRPRRRRRPSGDRRTSSVASSSASALATARPAWSSQLERRVVDRMDGVADDLVDHAAMIRNDPCRDVEIHVEQRHQIGGLGALGHAGETLDVGEQSGDLAHLAAQAQSAPGSAAMRRTTSGARCCSKLRRSSARAPLVACEPCHRRGREREDRDHGWAAGSISHSDAGTAANAAAVQTRQAQQRQRRRHRRAQPDRQQHTDPAEAKQGADRFEDVSPVRAGRTRRRAGSSRSPRPGSTPTVSPVTRG